MPTMRLFTCFLHLLAGLTLPAVSSQPLDLSAGNSSSETKVMPFQEVWNRSYCQAKEELVNILSEYPDEVAYIFKPPCVPLLRCAGCCGDEALHCVPVETANVTMQVLRISLGQPPAYVEMTFTQHTNCTCEPRPEVMQTTVKPEG
ncbi:unnamed protein product [Pipistrellus nathusii]|uniref:Platelet-derived growth factor (PDGF) family profile domain-containing protein n=1 Tax=Pipistrellus nathusii TaxID=59473 RepID=A0ABN9Z2S6_PIPNA